MDSSGLASASSVYGQRVTRTYAVAFPMICTPCSNFLPIVIEKKNNNAEVEVASLSEQIMGGYFNAYLNRSWGQVARRLAKSLRWTGFFRATGLPAATVGG